MCYLGGMMQLEFSPKLETARSIVFRGNKPFSSLLVLLVRHADNSYAFGFILLYVLLATYID